MTMVTCSRCGEEKQQTEYHKSFVTKAGAQRYFRYCKVCAKKKAQGVIKQRARRVAGLDVDRTRARRLMQKYRITVADWDQMHDEQLGRCGICLTTLSDVKVCVDHDHATGDVRGLLCNDCNMGLGLLGDTSVRLLAAHQYLERAASRRLNVGLEVKQR